MTEQVPFMIGAPLDDTYSLANEPLKPYPFQEEGRDFLQANDHAFLADDMGVGKTVQAVIALRGEPVLIVCPPVAVGVWERHLRDWSDYKYTTCDKLSRFPKAGEALILPRSRLPTHPDIVRAREEKAQETENGEWAPYGSKESKAATFPHWKGMDPNTTLIVDEAHEYKNHKSARTVNLQVLMNSGPKRRWGLTGTPILSYAQELWTLSNLFGVARRAYPKGLSQFRRLYGASLETVKYGKKAWKWGVPPPEFQAEREAAFQRFALRRLKKEVTPWLPEKTREFLKIEIEPEEEVDELTDYGKGWTHDRVDRAMRSPSSIDFATLSSTRALLSSQKIDAALEIIEQFEEAGEPLIVFSAHREPIMKIGGRKKWGRILGGTPIEQRGALCDAFEAGRLKGIACTIAAAGVGITLTRGANVLFVGRDYTPALNRQAEDRAYRIGQKRKVRVMILVTSHPVDLLVEAVISRKEELERSTFMDM